MRTAADFMARVLDTGSCVATRQQQYSLRFGAEQKAEMVALTARVRHPPAMLHGQTSAQLMTMALMSVASRAKILASATVMSKLAAEADSWLLAAPVQPPRVALGCKQQLGFDSAARGTKLDLVHEDLEEWEMRRRPRASVLHQRWQHRVMVSTLGNCHDDP